MRTHTPKKLIDLKKAYDPKKPGFAGRNRMNFSDEFKTRVELMKSFCDTAKSYVQISSAALALPLVFTQAVLGKEAAEKGLRAVGLPHSLVLAWIFFLLAIGFGLSYQWLANRSLWDQLHRAHRTSVNATEPGYRTTSWIPQFRGLNRSLLFGGMLMFFYIGAIQFVRFAAHSFGR